MRVKNRRALELLVFLLGYLIISGWLLWQAFNAPGDPPLVAFAALAVAVAILFDRPRLKDRR